MASYDITIRCRAGIDKYPAKSHARRVAKCLGLTTGLIVLEGARTAYYSSSDQTKPFRQDRYFYYLSGCSEPNAALSYDLSKDWLTLYLPPVDWDRFYYDGRGITAKQAMQKFDIDEARHLLNTDPTLPLLHRMEQQTDCSLLCMSAIDIFQFGGSTKTCSSSRLRPALDQCRSIKDEYEIRMIRKANELSAQAYRDVIMRFHSCTTEAEAEAIYMSSCIASLAKTQAYEPIFGSGPNASTLHYIRNNMPFGDGQVLLIDAGCEWQCYASDVTRTLPINRESPGTWPSREVEMVYQAVERIQVACLKLMKPGNRFSVVSLTSQRLVIKELLDIGIFKGTEKDIEEAGTARAFLPHAVGHHLGLEVHDVQPPSLIKTGCKKKRAYNVPSVFGGARYHGATALNDRMLDAIYRKGSLIDPPMEPGNVITVEPGIYFNEFELRKFYLQDPKHSKFIDAKILDRFMPVGGVRIEDDILITEDGHENLTTAPKGEEMMALLRHENMHLT